MFSSVLFWLKTRSLKLLVFSQIVALTVFYLWVRDITREASYQGFHSLVVQLGLKWGLFWFLFSEVWFFFSVFWRFFHFSSAPVTSIMEWPLFGVRIIIPFQVPLLNTFILLIRGVVATLAHHRIQSQMKNLWIRVTVILGVYFLSVQFFEYKNSFFSINRGVYGRIFFFGTGFHGLHVLMGTLMLIVREFRNLINQFRSFHHFGLEFRLWYWHFVDVVWLFLFVWVYFWGSY